MEIEKVKGQQLNRGRKYNLGLEEKKTGSREGRISGTWKGDKYKRERGTVEKEG